jgi:Cys-tRNA synthase (O-phospho-L-seryl-tRNA:Cys-tRNA synthase)
LGACTRDLAHLAELEPLRRGGVTFRRDTLVLVGWWDPGVLFDWDGPLDEVSVPVPELYVDEGTCGEEIDRRQNVARCRLLISHAVERLDQSITLMADAIDEVHGDEA